MQKKIASALFSALICTMAINSAQATILTFNIDNLAGNPPGGNIQMKTNFNNYGDGVNSLTQNTGSNIYNYAQGNAFTPNVNVNYDQDPSTQGIHFYTDGDAAVSPTWKDVAFLWSGGSTTTRKYWFEFVPSASQHGIKINSFDLFRYTNNENQNVTWTLYKDTVGGPVLQTSTTGNFNTTIASPLTVNTAGQVYFGTVVLEIHHSLGNGGGFALDNLNFDQVELPPAPEPTSMALLGMGSVFMFSRRRRAGH
jgi:hypothetical protein